jgi:transposase InsO family protein
VKRLCQVLRIARSSFYHWKATAPARAARHGADAALAARIRAVHTPFDGTYGVPRITAELRDPASKHGGWDGEPVNHKRVARIMRGIGLAGLRLRRRTRTTIADPNAAKAPDLISRDRLTGWAIADHMRTELDLDALHAAQRTRGSLDGAVLHTDHGARYTSKAFAAACTAAGIRQSMSTVDSPADNALAESFNATLKRETLQGRRAFTDEREARLSTFRWLNRYNTVRRHSRLRQRSPITYENSIRTTSTTLAAAA